MDLFNRYIQVDEEGYFVLNNERIENAELGRSLIENTKPTEGGVHTTVLEDTPVSIEAFDQPFVARHVRRTGDSWRIELPYEVEMSFDPRSLRVDDWDRFLGHTALGVSFVMAPEAQDEFFDLCDAFDDESVTIDGERIPVESWLSANVSKTKPRFWDEVYEKESVPGFDLQQPHPTLITVLNKLKLPKSRILILGAGQCNDAVYLADQGHLVTAVDFSAQGFEEAVRRHGPRENLKMVQSDIFQLPREFDRSFDIIFEHTCYCAIDPARRNELVQIWRRCLVDTGYLLGIFFAMDKPTGPPYGGSEWEVRERLKRHFQFLYWSRSYNSTPSRQGVEFSVYALKKSL